MELTFIGLIQIVVGAAIVLFGGPGSAFIFLIVSGLFDGSAAILLPSLGGSSIPPVQFALLFVYLRIFAPKGGLYGYFPDAVRANAWLVLFCFYGIANSYIGPRLFGGAIAVYPMRPIPGSGLFDVIPLGPTSQNLTAATYLVGTLLLAVAAYIFCQARGSKKVLIDTAIWSGWFFIITGLLDLVARGTPLEDVLAIFRNGDYVQMNVEVDGFVRIRGLLPEASSYAGSCFIALVVNAELWYRSIRPRQTGLLATILTVMLVISTSSTAYVALAGYALIFLARALAFPTLAPQGKIQRLALVGFMIVFMVAILMASIPEVATAIGNLVLEMTVAKSSTDSGQQRLFWAMQGIHGLIDSYGLGIGPGSFRSSSMLTAIIGAMGVIGSVSFVMYLLTIFQPSRRSSWGIGADSSQTLGGAFASAAVFSLIPAAIASPLANPVAIFSILSGAALALRPGREAAQANHDPVHGTSRTRTVARKRTAMDQA
ncbi:MULTISPECIES: glycoside hydrolase [Novosphingobium]|uniref:Uncharacterized protein n=1 Tax=Novosphingobium mathurense TaxID=428990 RepID=A0A1U6HMC1_9SPHN|nr:MULTISPECIES: glycoside hydrolase [Novosphingobium]CDO34253.1 conserved membrane hypothetical protein [Novosphingobium sp. KN65.2]SLJ96913.1 hypothetical protein SAMN06295987_102754 [Novosphingobium mathurense]